MSYGADRADEVLGVFTDVDVFRAWLAGWDACERHLFETLADLPDEHLVAYVSKKAPMLKGGL